MVNNVPSSTIANNVQQPYIIKPIAYTEPSYSTIQPQVISSQGVQPQVVQAQTYQPQVVQPQVVQAQTYQPQQTVNPVTSVTPL